MIVVADARRLDCRVFEPVLQGVPLWFVRGAIQDVRADHPATRKVAQAEPVTQDGKCSLLCRLVEVARAATLYPIVAARPIAVGWLVARSWHKHSIVLVGRTTTSYLLSIREVQVRLEGGT